MSTLIRSISLTARTTKWQPARSAHRVIQSACISTYKKPFFDNEPCPDYEKGSPERAGVSKAIQDLKAELPVQIPLNVGGQEVSSSTIIKQPNPSQHQQTVAEWTPATRDHVNQAIDAALKAKPAWESLPFESRAAVFLRAAELVAGKYRYDIIAATMLGQGKNIWQAEIDAAAETIDLFRFYVQSAMDLFTQQPAVNPSGIWNRMEYRALEGFVYAISPFNFTALGANLVCAPALMGNVVVWKPSLSALHASWLLYKIMLEAGLPENVIQFIPGDADEVTDAVLARPEFASLNFIGSTQVFKGLYGKIGKGTAEDRYLSYPRVVGETGGKNFHVVHGSADIVSAVNNTIRGAFEYQGQKCSATSRLYIAESVWPEFRDSIVEKTKTIKFGDPENFENYVNSVIHEASFDKLANVLQQAKTDPSLEILVGGDCSKEVGYFVQPTIIQTSDPSHEFMKRELFGPVLTVYVFPDAKWSETLKMVDSTAKYGLTGSVFAQDQNALYEAEKALRHSAGNFYINTKSTGSVVAQQPFGGSRGSGTNDKVGTQNMLSRFCSVRAIKEDFSRLDKFTYPSNEI